jgi:hypothetical protein
MPSRATAAFSLCVAAALCLVLMHYEQVRLQVNELQPAAARPADAMLQFAPLNFTRRAISRRPLVYIYDWPAACFALKLCEAPTLKAALAAQCREMSSLTALSPILLASVQRSLAGVCDGELGFGARMSAPLLDVEERDSDHHAAALLTSARLFSSQWRTLDPARARVFYIPYDPLTDLFEPGPPTLASASYFASKQRWLHSHVLRSPHFARSAGTDHFLVDGMVRQYATTRGAFLDGALANVTKLSLENFMYPPAQRDARGRSVHRSGVRCSPSRCAFPRAHNAGCRSRAAGRAGHVATVRGFPTNIRRFSIRRRRPPPRRPRFPTRRSSTPACSMATSR